jgi:acyl-CoA synthetase (AMP-forming)/AMP-acid ligase II
MPFQSLFPPVEIPRVTLHEFVLAGAAARADAPALVDGLTGRVLTYGQLVDQVRRLAAGLSRRGIGQRDVVAIWSPNSPEYAVVFHAVSRLGAILTTVNPSYTVEELAYQLKDAGAKLVFTTAALLDKARAAADSVGVSIEIITLDEAAGMPSLASVFVDAEPPQVTIDPDRDLVVLPYSSGTTGLPKGVMLTHRNVVANLIQIDAMDPADLRAVLGVLPFFHIYGMVVIMNFGLLRGCVIPTLPRFDLETVLRLIQDYQIALVHVVPPVAIAFAKHPSIDNYDLSKMRWLFSGAAPLGREITDAIETRLPIRVRQGYGMTEASPVTHYTTADQIRAGKVGLLVPSSEMRLIDPVTGNDQPVGEAGEVWIRGPHVMRGYLNNPEATARTVDADGWLHTGDIGVQDADGYLEVVDRLKELIKVKGFQVAPAELEALLLKHPKIADVAVYGVADDECGEVPKAIVVIREPLSADEVMAFVASHVATYKRLRYVAFAEAIPKSPSGKILRRVLVAAERAAKS